MTDNLKVLLSSFEFHDVDSKCDWRLPRASQVRQPQMSQTQSWPITWLPLEPPGCVQPPGSAVTPQAPALCHRRVWNTTDVLPTLGPARQRQRAPYLVPHKSTGAHSKSGCPPHTPHRATFPTPDPWLGGPGVATHTSGERPACLLGLGGAPGRAPRSGAAGALRLQLHARTRAIVLDGSWPRGSLSNPAGPGSRLFMTSVSSHRT